MSSTNQNRDSLAMSEKMKYSVSVGVLLLGVGIFFLLYSLREQNEKSDSKALTPTVNTTLVSAFEGKLDLEVSGTVVSFREIRVGAEVSGVISRKYEACRAGNFVKQGTKLLEIDRRDYDLEIKTLELEREQATRTINETVEEINGARDNIADATTDLELQTKEYNRTKKLANSLSDADMDRAQRALNNAKTQLTLRNNSMKMLEKKKLRLEASLDLIDNRLERAKLNLERTVIKAPTDGIVVAENVQQGDFVTVARELLMFECTSRVEVQCNLTPGELEWIRKYAKHNDELQDHELVYGLPKLEVKLFEKGNESVSWKGILERFDGYGLNETTKSVPCRIVVENPVAVASDGRKRALVRGMYLKCNMGIPVSHLDDKLVTFPSSALRPGDYAWIVRDKKLNKFYVDVVDRTPPQESHESPRVVVDIANSGMVIGDQIITSPIPTPVEGGAVEFADGDQELASRDMMDSKPTSKNVKETNEPAVRTTNRNGGDDMKERSQP